MKKHKIVSIVLLTVAAVIAALAIFLLVWFFGDSYPRFDSLSRAEAPIPGLPDGFCPQGLCRLPQNDGGYSYAVSGYLSDSPSRVYLVGETEKYVVLQDEKGREIATHFGGITCTGDDLVVASGKRLVRVPLSEALLAENGGTVQITDGFEVAGFRSVAYCYYADGILYAGEFYRPGNYETDQSHHLSLGGETNYGIVYAYETDGTKAGGVKSERPLFAISVRAQVQGFAVWEDGIALSTSYGLPNSRLWFYENPMKGEPSGELDGTPLYVLGESNLTAAVDLPCMSEEIFEEGGRIYLLFESKANKYKLFVRRQISDIYSLPVQTDGIDG